MIAKIRSHLALQTCAATSGMACVTSPRVRCITPPTVHGTEEIAASQPARTHLYQSVGSSDTTAWTPTPPTLRFVLGVFMLLQCVSDLFLIVCGSPLVQECPGKDSIYYSDGFCDMYRFDLDSYLNTDLCGWDGGDCCPSNCSMNGDACDNYVYACMDPSAEDNGDFSSCAVASSSWVGDSVCDADSLGYNTAACGWDGGDCCESTCDGRNSAQCGEANYFCIDPDADETQVVDGECNVAYDSYLGDGACDPMDTYNTLACGWDGGDCCKSTCESTASTTCGDSGWLCLDPAGSNCAVDNPSYLGDGYCDAVEESHGYNTRGCNWDGGDCCISTCGTYVAVYGSLTFDCGSIGTTTSLMVLRD